MGIAVSSASEQAAVAAAQEKAREEEAAQAAAAAAKAKASKSSATTSTSSKTSTVAKSSPTASTAALVQSLGDKGTAITGSTAAKSSKATSAPKLKAGPTTSTPSSVSAFIPGVSLFKPNTSVSTKTAGSGVSLTALLTRAPGTGKVPLVVKSTATRSSAGTGKTGTSGAGAGPAPGAVANPGTELAKLNSMLASQSKQYKADMEQLNQEEATLAQQKKQPQGPTNAKATSYGSQVTAADAQVVATQETVVKNAKAKMDAEQSSVTAEVQAQNTASTYHESAPGVTANTKLTRAMTGVQTAAANNTKAKQATVNEDKTNLSSTDAVVNNADHLAAENPMMAGRLIGGLRQTLNLKGQQTATLKTDTGALTTAQHNQSAVDDAVGIVDYSGQKGSQTAADVSRFDTQLKQLQKSGVLNSKGALTKSPSGSQRVQFEQLIATGDKIAPQGTDAAAFNQALAGLKLDASLYGSTTQGAVKSVNTALKGFGLQLSTPKAESVSKARAQVSTANAQAKQADMQWDVDSRAATTDAQQQKVAKLAAEIPTHPNDTALVTQLKQQDQTLQKDEGSYGQAVSYQGKSNESAALTQDGQAVTTAQKRFAADPTGASSSSLRTAQARQSQAQEQEQIDEDGLITSSAQVDGATQLSQQDVNGILQTAFYQQQNPAGVAANVLPNPTLQKEVSGAQTVAAQAGTSGQALTFNYWNSAGNLQTKEDTGWELGQLQAGVPVASAAAVSAVAQGSINGAWQTSEAAAAMPQTAGGKLSGSTLKTDEQTLAWQMPVAKGDFGQSDFNATQPAYLLNPQTQADQNTETQAWDSYAKQQGLMMDPTTLASLNNLGAGQKADLGASESEVSADQTQLTQISAARPWSEQAWDGVTGQNPTSAWSTMLTGTQKTLSNLSNDPGESAAQFNLTYEQATGGLSGSNQSFEQNARSNVQMWQQGQSMVVDTVAGLATLADPLAGAVFGLVLEQGSAAVDNALTATEGGKVTDDAEVSLASAFTNNFGVGGDSTAEKEQAGVDAGVDLINTAATVAGAGAAESLGTRVGTAVATRLGTEAATQVGADAATQVGTKEASSFAVRAATNAATWTGFNAASGVGQVAGTAAKAFFAVSQGQKTSGQAWSEIGNSAGQALFNTAAAAVVAPLAEGVGEVALSPLGEGVSQGAGKILGMAAGNAASTVSYNYLTGQPVTGLDWMSVGANTVIGVGLGMREGEPETGESGETQTSTEEGEGPRTNSLGAAYSPEKPAASPEEVQRTIDNWGRGNLQPLDGTAVSREQIDAVQAQLGPEEPGYLDELARQANEPQMPTARVSLPEGTEAQTFVDQMPEMLNSVRDNIADVSTRGARWVATVNAARDLDAIENRYNSVIEDVDLTPEERLDRASLLVGTRAELRQTIDSIWRTLPSDDVGRARQASYLTRRLTEEGPTSDDAQARFLGDVYDKLVQQRGPGEQGDYYANAFSKEEFVNSFVSVPNDVFSMLSKAVNGSRPASAYQQNDKIVVPDGLADMSGVANQAGVGRYGNPTRWYPAIDTYEHVVNHEASHLLSGKLNPEFRQWASEFASATGLHPEEMFASLDAHDQSPSRASARQGETFPNLAEQAAAMGEWNSGAVASNRTSAVLTAYEPETDTGDFFYNVAGTMELSQRNPTLAPEDVQTQYSPDEIRAAGRDLVNRARLGGDPQATATVKDLIQNWALPFFKGLTGKASGPGTASSGADGASVMRSEVPTPTSGADESLTPAETGPDAGVTPGDAWGVTNTLAAENGDRLSGGPRFGSSRQDRSALAAARTTLQGAHYSDGVIGQLGSHLQSLSSTEGRTLARQVQQLGVDEASRIQTSLLNQLPYLHDGALDAHVVATLAGLSSGDRNTVLTNAEGLFANPDAGQRQSLDNYLGLPGQISPGRSAASDATELTAILWQPKEGATGAPDRQRVMDSLSGLRDGESPPSGASTPSPRTLQRLRSQLTEVAARNNTPGRLMDFRVDPTTDRLTSVMKGSALFAARGQTGASDYWSAGSDVYAQMQARRDENDDGKDADLNFVEQPFNAAIDVGAPAQGDSVAGTASAYGPPGAAAVAHSLQVAADSAGVPLNLTFRTDAATAPVLQATLDAAGIADPDIQIAGGSTQEKRDFLNTNTPDAFISIGRFDRDPTEMLNHANWREGTTTYSVIDGTPGSESDGFANADHPLVAADVNTGALGLSATMLHAAGALDQMMGPEEWSNVLRAARDAGAVRDDSRFASGLSGDAITDAANVGSWYRVSEAADAGPQSGASGAESSAWRDQVAAEYEHAQTTSDPATRDAALSHYNQLSELASPPAPPEGIRANLQLRAGEVGRAVSGVTGQITGGIARAGSAAVGAIPRSVRDLGPEFRDRVLIHSPTGSYPEVEDSGGTATPAVHYTPREVQVPSPSIDGSVLPGIAGRLYSWAIKRYVGQDAVIVEQQIRVQRQSLLSQRASYLSKSAEFQTPEEAGSGTPSYVELTHASTLGGDASSSTPRWTQETSDSVDAVLDYGHSSADPNIRDAAAVLRDELMDRPPGELFTGKQTQAVADFFGVDRGSRYTGSKESGTRSTNAFAALDALFDNTRFEANELTQAASNLPKTFLSGTAADTLPKTGTLLTQKQSRDFGERMLDILDPEPNADLAQRQSPLSDEGVTTLRNLLGSASLSKQGLRQLSGFVGDSMDSPDQAVSEAAWDASDALNRYGRTGPVSLELMEGLVPLFKADQHSRWAGTDPVESSAKGTLSPLAESLQSRLAAVDLSQGSAGDSLAPRVERNVRSILDDAQSYIGLKTRSSDPVVKSAAKEARAASRIAAKKDSSSSELAAGLSGLHTLLDSDRASWDRQRDRVTGTTGNIRTDKGLAMKNLEVSELPENFVISAGVESIESDISGLASVSAPIYTVTFDVSENVNKIENPDGTGFLVHQDPSDPSSPYVPNFNKVEGTEDTYEFGADAYVRIIANRTMSYKLPLSISLDRIFPHLEGLGTFKVAAELEMRHAKNLFTYEGQYSKGKPRAGWTIIPKGTRLTGEQVRLFENGFQHGKAPYLTDGEVTDHMYGIYQNVLPENMPKPGDKSWGENWRTVPLGSLIPREAGAGSRRVMDRINVNISVNATWELPWTKTVEHQTGLKWPPSQTLYNVQVGLLDRVVLEHPGSDHGPVTYSELESEGESEAESELS